MAVSITIAKMPEDIKNEEPKAEGAEPETHEGLIKDKKVVALLDMMKELGVSDELIEKVEEDLGVEEEEEGNLEKEGKDEGSEAEGTTGQGAVVCPQDAKLCSDGSAVGRTGPNCEFAVCPSVSAEVLKKGNFAGHYRGESMGGSLELQLKQENIFLTGAYCAQSKTGVADCDPQLKIQTVPGGNFAAPIQGYVDVPGGTVLANVWSYKTGQSSRVRLSKDGDDLVWQAITLADGVLALPANIKLQLVH